jgi:cytochrome P450
MYDNLKSIYFDYAFSDDGSKLDQIIDIMNKTIAVRFDEFLPKIVDEAQSTVSSLKGTMKLTPITIGFVSRTSARCFLGFSLTDKIYNVLSEFTNLLNIVTTLTYFFPKWLIRQTIGRKLVQKRKAFNTLIKPYIEEYRQNPNKNESLMIRHCVDRTPKISDDDICDTIICLMYVSSENTALGLNATLIDLLKNPIYMEKLRAEIFKSDDDKK